MLRNSLGLLSTLSGSHTHISTPVGIHTTCIYTNAHGYAYTHAQACTHTHTHTCTHIHLHTHTCMHIHTHVCTSTHTYTHTLMYRWFTAGKTQQCTSQYSGEISNDHKPVLKQSTWPKLADYVIRSTLQLTAVNTCQC